MNSFEYFFYLASGAVEFLGLFALVSVPLSITALCLVGCALARGAVKPGRLLVAFIAPAIIPICILMVGVAFVRPEAGSWANGPPIPWFPGIPDEYAHDAIGVLLLLNLPLGLAFGYWVRREWPAVTSTTLWWGLVSICASTMATMSITGNWL
jgi:hypothetical protein